MPLSWICSLSLSHPFSHGSWLIYHFNVSIYIVMILLGISMDDIMALWENNLRENWENNLRERIISEKIGRNWENLEVWFYTQGERVKSPVWFHYEINAMKTEIIRLLTIYGENREREREREEIGLNAYLRTKYVLVCAYKDVRTSLSPEWIQGHEFIIYSLNVYTNTWIHPPFYFFFLSLAYLFSSVFSS